MTKNENSVTLPAKNCANKWTRLWALGRVDEEMDELKMVSENY